MKVFLMLVAVGVLVGSAWGVEVLPVELIDHTRLPAGARLAADLRDIIADSKRFDLNDRADPRFVIWLIGGNGFLFRERNLELGMISVLFGAVNGDLAEYPFIFGHYSVPVSSDDDASAAPDVWGQFDNAVQEMRKRHGSLR